MADPVNVTEVHTVTTVVYSDGKTEQHTDARSFNGNSELNRNSAQQLGQFVVMAIESALGLDSAD